MKRFLDTYFPTQWLYIFVLVGVSACLILTFLGCSEKNSTAALEQQRTEVNQQRLLKQQPPVSLNWSLERQSINRRAKLWNDPAKVSYIYLVNYGKVMAFYPVKGKVSSVNSQITNPEQVVYRGHGDGRVSSVISSPAEDGSYGSNGDAVFFFTTNGTYVEWSGDYMLADKPLKLSTPPQLIMEVK